MLHKSIDKLNFFRIVSLMCIITFGLIINIGCGGGGGDTPPPASITYTGITTQAEITDANAEVIAAGAFEGGRAGSALSVFGAVENGTVEDSVSFRTLKIPQVLEDALFQVDLSFVSGGPYIGATQSENGTISDTCGDGTASYTIRYDDQTGVFSGSFSFNSYCGGGVTFSGSVNFSGSLDLSDPNNPSFNEFTFTFTNLSDGSGTLNGTVNIDFSTSPIIVSFNAYLKVNTTKKVYWVRDYDMYITEGADGIGNYVDLEIVSGTYYDPDYGYITIETTTPIRTYEIDKWPSDGVIVVTGYNNNKVRLTVIDETQCEIDADLDGIDGYEWGPRSKDWEEL